VRGVLEVNSECAAYKAAVTAELPHVVNQLRSTLGVGTVAKLAGVGETRAVNEWARGNRSVRSPDVEGRLRLAFQLVEFISNEVSREVAARWFKQPNPALKYRTPEGVIGTQDLEDAGSNLMEAARVLGR
jgi:hypothetical protein